MSDIQPDLGGEPTGDAAGAAEAAAVEDFLDSLDLSAESFPREYVEKIRNEAASYRTKYAPYRDIFGEVPDEVREYILNDVVAPLVSATPGTALDELYDLVERIHSIDNTKPRWAQQAEAVGAAEPTTVAPTKPPVDDENTPLTKAEWKRIQAEEAQAERERNAVEEILAGAESLGYHRTGELGDDMASLLYLSTHVTKGDINKAHEIRLQRFNEAVEAAVEARIADLRSGASKWPPVSTSGQSAIPEGAASPKTFAEAAARAKKRLEAAFGE